MIGNHTHGDVYFFVFAIFGSTNATNFGNDRSENVSVIIRLNTLHGHTQTFEAHAGINHLGRKSFERAIGFAVVLHKHIVPNLNHLRVTSVYKRQTVNLSAVFVATDIDMNFGAGATWSCVSHFPEIIFLISIDNTIFW